LDALFFRSVKLVFLLLDGVATRRCDECLRSSFAIEAQKSQSHGMHARPAVRFVKRISAPFESIHLS
jgi:hypothetical protein